MAASGSNATFDIILLFGPSVPNKPGYLPPSFLSTNITVICPNEVYEKNPDHGLRDVALKAVAALKERKQVLINDEFRLSATRKSLVETIKKKIPKCHVQLVQIIPAHGFLQLMWLHQFALAQGDPSSSLQDENHLRQWFETSLQHIDYTSGYVDRPWEQEGYAIHHICVPLQVRSHFKLEIPALFLQWEGTIDDTEKFSPQVETLCSKWVMHNTCGRIIFICDGKNVARGRLSSSDENSNIKQCLKELSDKIKYPVYALQLISTNIACNFCVPPEPGMLAFLQIQHLLNLHSKRTCYLFDTIDHMRMAEAAGIRHIRISAALKSPDMILKGHGTTPSVPAILRSFIVTKPEKDVTTSAPAVPLFDLRHNLKHGHVSCKFPNALEEHVYIKDVQSFCEYQEIFATHITPIDYHGSKLVRKDSGSSADAVETERERASGTSEKGRVSGASEKRQPPSASSSMEDYTNTNIPMWMRKRPRHEDSLRSPSILERSDSSDSNKSTHRSSRTVYLMSEQEVLDMAQQLLIQAGHEDIIRNAGMEMKGQDFG